MRDFVTLDIRAAENKKRLFECKDSMEESGHKLLVTLRATHAGIVNGNMRFYRPDRMVQSLSTWTPAGRIPNPVLIHHDKHGECFGRVMTAKYVDLSDQYVPDHVELKSNFFCDGRGGKKLGLYDSINWIVQNLQTKVEDFAGLGYTELGCKITHPDAIRKIMDGEFMGVSVGFGSDSGVCSICHTDWAKDGQCEHKLGRHYFTDKLCYLITGKHINKEVSFVNFPADVYARVTGTQALKEMADSLAVRFYFLGLPLHRQAEALNQDLQDYSDNLEFLGSDIELVAEAEMEKINVDELVAQVKGELTKDSALQLRKSMETLVDSVDLGEKRRMKRALVNLDSVIRKNGWTDAVTKEDVEARIAGLTDALAAITEPAAKAAHVSALEADAKTFGLEFTAPELNDEQEKIADPGPAAPVEATDAAAAPTPEVPPSTVTAEVTKDLVFKDSETGKKFVTALEALEAVACTIPEDEKWAAQDALYTLWEKINKCNSLEWAKRRLSKVEDATEMIVAKAEWDQIHDELAALDVDVKKLESSNTILMKSNRLLIDEQKLALAQQLVFGRVFSGDPAVKNMNADELRAEIGKKAGRNLASLTDAVADLTDSLPAVMRGAQTAAATTGGVPAAPVATDNTDSQAAETAPKEIKDSVQINGTEEPGNQDSETEDSGDGTENRPFIAPISRIDLFKRMARKRHQQLNS